MALEATGEREEERKSEAREESESPGRVLYPLFQPPDPTVQWERGRRFDGSGEETDGSGEVDDGSGEDEERSRVRVRD